MIAAGTLVLALVAILQTIKLYGETLPEWVMMVFVFLIGLLLLFSIIGFIKPDFI